MQINPRDIISLQMLNCTLFADNSDNDFEFTGHIIVKQFCKYLNKYVRKDYKFINGKLIAIVVDKRDKT